MDQLRLRPGFTGGDLGAEAGTDVWCCQQPRPVMSSLVWLCLLLFFDEKVPTGSKSPAHLHSKAVPDCSYDVFTQDQTLLEERNSAWSDTFLWWSQLLLLQHLLLYPESFSNIDLIWKQPSQPLFIILVHHLTCVLEPPTDRRPGLDLKEDGTELVIDSNGDCPFVSTQYSPDQDMYRILWSPTQHFFRNVGLLLAMSTSIRFIREFTNVIRMCNDRSFWFFSSGIRWAITAFCGQ